MESARKGWLGSAKHCGCLIDEGHREVEAINSASCQ